MPSPRVAPGPKFQTALATTLADHQVDKAEARKLRKLALVDLKDSPKPAALADAYSSKFESLQEKSADKVTGRYLATVGKEFTERANHQKASAALQTYLKAHAGSLPPLLKNIDVADTKGFAVGATLNRGIFLSIPIKDRSKLDETTAAVEQLFKSDPAMSKLGPIWVLG